MIEYLQVKIESLILETKLIRQMELEAKYKARVIKQRWKDGLTVTPKHTASPIAEYERYQKVNAGLHHHRTFDVRKEARWANIAYGCLLGKSYRQIEPTAYSQPDWERVERMVMKYSELDSRKTAQKFAEWKADALQNVKADHNKCLHPGSQRGQWTEWMHLAKKMQTQLVAAE